MAKRFIETSFFKDPFVRGLQGAYKGLYIYLFLDCSNAGIWNVELDVARLRCGIPEKVSDEEVKDIFSEKIIELEDGEKWFLKNYLKVQHNGLLKRNNKAHIAAIEELLKYGLIDEISDGEFQLSQEIIKGLPRGLQDPKVMVKVKEEGNGKGNGESEGNGKMPAKTENFQPEKVIDIFNKVCKDLPKVQKLTKTRKSTISARIKEYQPEDAEIFFEAIFGRVQKSRFLTGNNDRGWTADFDWILKPTNTIKILEGKYDEKGKSTQQSGGQYSDEWLRKKAEILTGSKSG